MARLNIVGFESGSASANVELAGTPTGTVVTTNKRTGSYAFYCNPTDAGEYGSIGRITSGTIGQAAINISGTAYYKFHVYFTAFASSGTDTFCAVSSAINDTGTANSLLTLTVSTTGAVVAVGATTSSTIGTLSLNTWHMIQIKAVTNTSNASEVSIDGGAVQTLTGRNVTQNYLVLGSSVTATNYDVYYDDVVIDDSVMPEKTSIKILVPTGAGTNNTDWANGTASSYTEVDEIPPDGATTYISETGTGVKTRDFAMQDSSAVSITAPTTIKTVKPMAIVRAASNSVGGSIAIWTRSDSVNAVGTAWTGTGTTYRALAELQSQTNNSTSWNISRLDGLQVGVQNNATGDGFCTAIYAVVEYIDTITSSQTGSLETDRLTGIVKYPFLQKLTGAISTLSGIVKYPFRQSLSGTISTISGSLNFKRFLSLVGSVSSISGFLNLRIPQRIFGSIDSVTGLLTYSVKYVISLAGSLTNLLGVISTAGSSFYRSVSGSIGNFTGELSKITSYLRSVTGSINSISSILDTVYQSGSAAYYVVVNGAFELSGAILKSLNKVLSLNGTIDSISGTMNRVAAHVISLTGDLSSISGSIAKSIYRVISLSGSLSSISSTLTYLHKNILYLTGSLSSVSGSISKATSYVRSLTGNLAILVGSLTRTSTFARSLSGAVGSMSNTLEQFKYKALALSGAFTMTGTLSSVYYKLRKVMKAGYTTIVKTNGGMNKVSYGIMKAGSTIVTKFKGGKTE